MTIQYVRCPRCAIRRTVRLGTWGAFCFNCRLQWDTLPAAQPATGVAGSTPPPVQYPFAPAELIRIERYRAAVQAGLYSDWPFPRASVLGESAPDDIVA
jgi:hypothetical protein